MHFRSSGSSRNCRRERKRRSWDVSSYDPAPRLVRNIGCRGQRVRDTCSCSGGRYMNSVEDLDVFKLSHQLAVKIYSVTKSFPREEMYSLVDQMRRAAISVGMNLMEGAMRLGTQGVPAICRHSARLRGRSLLSAACRPRSQLHFARDVSRTTL